MGKQRYIMANLVYGQLYPQLWLENQLKSLCDPTNLPALRERYDLEYVLFTDEATLPVITRHPNWMKLGQMCEINVVKLSWPSDADQFASRYGLLVQMFHMILNTVFNPEDTSRRGAWLSCWVADLVFAKHSLPRMLKRLEQGHDAVLNVPIRSAADSVNDLLTKLPGAPTDLELFEMAYRNLHHLWVASHWDAPLFSKFPYSMLWNSYTGLAAHHFGVTPIVFKAHEDLRAVQGVIDSDVPAFFKNPYWATDWTDAAVAGVEPLSNGHYPPFLQHAATAEFVVDWAKRGTQPVQVNNLDRVMYYPSKQTFNAPALAAQALEIVTNMKNLILTEQGKSHDAGTK